MKSVAQTHQPGQPVPAFALHQRAPARAQTTAGDPRSLADTAQPLAATRRLLRDCRARQLDLETQHARLQEICSQLRGRLQKYTELYDHATVACLNLDSQGTIREANLAATRLLGLDRAELLRQRFDTYLEEAGRPAFLTLLQSVFSTRAPVTAKLVVQPLGAPWCWVQFIAAVSTDGQECCVSLVQLPPGQPAEERWRKVRDRLNQRLQDYAVKLAAGSAALLDSQARFRELFDSAPNGIALHDGSGHYLQVNPAYTHMLGYPEPELLRLGAKGVTHPEDVEEGRRLFGELRDGLRDRYQRQKRFLRADGQIVWAISTASAVRATGGKLRYVISLVHDITERRAAEQALLRSQRSYRELVENANSIILRWDRQYQVTFLNEFGQKFFGVDALSFLGQALVGVIVPEFESTGRDLRQLFRQIAAQPQDCQTTSCEVLSGDGQNRWVTWSNRAVHNEQGEVTELLSVGTDVTERREMQRQLLNVAEEERQRIGRDLHDSMGGQLAGAGILAAVLARKLAVAAHPDTHFAERILQVVNQAILQTRSIAQNLCPVTLDGGNLLNALRDFADTASVRFQISCQLETSRHPKVSDPSVATHLLRIVEEAVTNAVRHGKARRVSISLREQQGQISLAIRDDGVGFLSSQPSSHGLGLRTMRYRAELLGAEISFGSSPEGGACVCCRLPLVPTP
jgi:PAS domain S-box-containing protein